MVKTAGGLTTYYGVAKGWGHGQKGGIEGTSAVQGRSPRLAEVDASITLWHTSALLALRIHPVVVAITLYLSRLGVAV